MSIEKGAKEIELTSQDTGAYGLDRKTNITELVSKVSDLDGDFRIRIGMLNPEHLNRYFDELIACYSNEKVYKFLHIPVQSGSNRVLKEMKRRYTIEEFDERVKEIREKVEEISIATDVIVGYPTESDEEFRETLDLLNRIRPEITNVSKFGVRPHSPASKLKPLGSRIVKERSTVTSRLVRSIQHEQRSALVGRTERVLITERNKRSLTGRDECYREVAVVKGFVDLGAFINVRIVSSSSGCLIAESLGGSV
jgi:MiaB/RimO family radical SAM methylthiotransferase